MGGARKRAEETVLAQFFVGGKECGNVVYFWVWLVIGYLGLSVFWCLPILRVFVWQGIFGYNNNNKGPDTLRFQ